MHANANQNEWHGPPIMADDDVKTGRLREEDNATWRPRPLVPFALRPKTPIAALRSLAGCPDPPATPRVALGVFGGATRLRP